MTEVLREFLYDYFKSDSGLDRTHLNRNLALKNNYRPDDSKTILAIYMQCLTVLIVSPA